MRIMLLLAKGASYSEIKEKLNTTAPTIALWKQRYSEEGLVGWRRCIPDSRRGS